MEIVKLINSFEKSHSTFIRVILSVWLMLAIIRSMNKTDFSILKKVWGLLSRLCSSFGKELDGRILPPKFHRLHEIFMHSMGVIISWGMAALCMVCVLFFVYVYISAQMNTSESLSVRAWLGTLGMMSFFLVAARFFALSAVREYHTLKAL